MDFQWLLLLGSGFIAGMINAVAGGGTILIYPLLLALGIPPIAANASSNGVVFLGLFSSAYGYRKYIINFPKKYYLLIIPAIIGCLIGVSLLANTSNQTFEYIVPWLVLIATVLLALQPKVQSWLYTKRLGKAHRHSKFLIFSLISVGVFGLSIYGGYFGAGFGIMTIAILGYSELTNIHELNSLKNMIALFIGTICVVYLSFLGLIEWSVIPLMMIGNVIGGWFGATYSTRLPSKLIRNVVVGIAIFVSAALFAKRYL